MPDHLHLLLEGRFANSDLKRFVSSYKQHTGYRYKLYVAQGFSPAQLGQLKLWQTSYYDHVLRKDEDILDIARYILNNPTRKKLVKHFLEYKFVGSFEIETDSLMQG